MKVNCFTFCQLIKLLAEGTRNCQELAEETGLNITTVYQYTKEFHKQKLTHIAMWEKDAANKDSIRIYMWGPGRDAKRSKLSDEYYAARAREKRRNAKLTQAISTHKHDGKNQSV